MAVVSAALGGIIAVLGELRDELGFSNVGIGAVVTAGFFASFLTQIGLSPLADRGHGRAMAIIGTFVSAGSLLLMAVADTVTVWILARAALGFAGGLMLPGIRRAAVVVDPERSGENLGRLVVSEVIGFTLGPLAAAALVEVGGIRAPFIGFAAGLLLFVPFVVRLPNDQGARTDRARNSFELLRVRRLQGALLLVFGYFFLIGAFESVLPVMFQDRGGGALETGLAFTIFGIPIAAVSPHAGRVADRVGGAKVALIGMAISATMTTFYGFIPGLWPLIAVMSVVGIADGYGFTAGQVLVSRSVREERQAAALGLMGAAGVLGAGVSALPMASLYEARGDRATWAATGLCSLALLGLGWWRLRDTEPVSHLAH